MTLLQDHRPTVGDPEGDGAEALIEEARRRHRRRRRRVAMIGLVLAVAGGSLAAVVTGRTPGRSAIRPGRSAGRGDGVQAAAPPPGPTVPLRAAGPLAVGPGGQLYVADEARNEVVVRQPDGSFRLVAGGGQDRGTGGGPATAAALADISGLAFDARGDLYIADGHQVQEVNAAGTIRTVATVASHGPLTSIALSPQGTLYLATTDQLLRVDAGGTLHAVRAVVTTGPGAHGPLVNLGQIAVDGRGDIYASCGFRGWSFYRVAPDGVATYLGYARKDGGAYADVTREPNGAVEVETGSTVREVVGDRLTTTHAFDAVPGTRWFTLSYFAVAPDGTLFADDLASVAYQPLQQLVAVSGGRTRVLWDHANRA